MNGLGLFTLEDVSPDADPRLANFMTVVAGPLMRMLSHFYLAGYEDRPFEALEDILDEPPPYTRLQVKW